MDPNLRQDAELQIKQSWVLEFLIQLLSANLCWRDRHASSRDLVPAGLNFPSTGIWGCGRISLFRCLVSLEGVNGGRQAPVQ